MKEISDVVACVIDHSTFFCLAQRLARDFKKVYYHWPNGDGFKTVAKGAMGDGHPDVELLEDFWPIKKEIDVFICPDIGDSGLQLELESQGFPVWGSRDADELEVYRGRFLAALKELGLPVPETKVIKGMDNLRAYLKDHNDVYVKISKWRGDFETHHCITYRQSEPWLDMKAIRFGPLKNEIIFYVQKPVATKIEAGSDTYSVDGQWPSKIILGYEKKGESYLATIKDRAEMPPEVWGVNEAFEPYLRQKRYRNFISTEERIKGDKTYYIDCCHRMGSPSGEEQLEMYDNLGEIIYKGAQGELVEPEVAAKFCGEAVVCYTGEKGIWKTLEVPDEAKRWFKPYACLEEDDAWHWPPESESGEVVGCIVGLGDTIEEVISHLKETEEMMKDLPVEIHIEPMAALLEEVVTAEAAGIEFTDQEIPEPAIVLENGD